jgi:hypothetical protein
MSVAAAVLAVADLVRPVLGDDSPVFNFADIDLMGPLEYVDHRQRPPDRIVPAADAAEALFIVGMLSPLGSSGTPRPEIATVRPHLAATCLTHGCTQGGSAVPLLQTRVPVRRGRILRGDHGHTSS